ncbi:MAG TPA: guanylate kinase [Longimicrobiales bacterium]
MSVGSRPFPVVIAAPSGAGKTSLAQALVERNPKLVFSVSATTRPPRGAEQGGKDYRFVSDPEFDRMLEAGELLEWAVVHGRRYGTPRQEVENALARGQIPVLDIDVQGARQIRRAYPDAVLIFVLPPSAEELNHRLARRGTESSENRIRRLETARHELAAATDFDYVVVNDEFERALATLEAVITAEEARVQRQEDLAGEVERLERELGEILERSC